MSVRSYQQTNLVRLIDQSDGSVALVEVNPQGATVATIATIGPDGIRLTTSYSGTFGKDITTGKIRLVP